MESDTASDDVTNAKGTQQCSSGRRDLVRLHRLWDMAAARSPMTWRSQHALARHVGPPRPISKDADIGATVDRFDGHRSLPNQEGANGLERPGAPSGRAIFDGQETLRGNHVLDGHASSAGGKKGSSSCRHGPCQDQWRFRHMVEALARRLSKASAGRACSGSNRASRSSPCLVLLLMHPSKGSDPSSAQRGPSGCRSIPSVTTP